MQKEMIRDIADKTQLTHAQVGEVIELATDKIIETLLSRASVHIANLGVLKLIYRKPRMGRNPSTDEPVEIPARVVIDYKPNKALELRARKIDLNAAVEYGMKFHKTKRKFNKGKRP